MESFEAPGVEPVFSEKPQAINFAQRRASFRYGEIRILDSTTPGTSGLHRSVPRVGNVDLRNH
jgi:hypothetical protein